MSKSGLFAHFGSKEELQLSTLRAAAACSTDAAIVAGARRRAQGVARLHALLTAWFDYIDSDAFKGGCLFMEAAAEFDNRPGPVRDLVAETMGMWMDLLVRAVARSAIERGELEPGTDPEQLAWELHAFGLGLNWDRQLNDSPDARRRARTAIESRLRAAATTEGARHLP